MAEEETKGVCVDGADLPDADIKVILLGDSAVGKTKLMERFLMDQYHPRHLSTYALTLFRYNLSVKDKEVKVDFWDTAGQERFQKLHPSYYFQAHACVMVFDVTRKKTYQHLVDWHQELQKHCPGIPCIVVANKIDVNYLVTQKSFKFPGKHGYPFFYVSAADGTNVVKIFHEAIRAGWKHKGENKDFLTEMLELFDDEVLEKEEKAVEEEGEEKLSAEV